MFSGEWVTREGNVLVIAEMQTRHIINCIRMIERRGRWRRHKLAALRLQLEIRGREMG